MSSELLTTYLMASLALIFGAGAYFLRAAQQPECQSYSCRVQVEQVDVNPKPARIVFAKR